MTEWILSSIRRDKTEAGSYGRHQAILIDQNYSIISIIYVLFESIGLLCAQIYYPHVHRYAHPLQLLGIVAFLGQFFMQFVPKIDSMPYPANIPKPNPPSFPSYLHIMIEDML